MTTARHVIPLAAFLAACAPEPSADFDVDVAIDERVATVLNVSWTTDEPGISWVEFGREGSFDLATPTTTEAGTEHGFQLLGVSADTEVTFRCVTETASGELVREGSATTGSLPEEVTRFRVDLHDEALASDQKWVLTGYESEDGSWMVALDRRGGVVWYEPVPEHSNPYTVEPFDDGPGLIYNARKSDGARDNSWLVTTTLLDGVDGMVSLPLGHHGMTQLPRGGVAWISNDIRPWRDPRDGEMVDVVGDAINIHTPEGDDLLLFSTWDWAVPGINPWFDENFYPGAKDWTHANTVDHNEHANSMLLSLRNLALLLEIDMVDGEVLRTLGGEAPEAFTPGSSRFAYQHDPNWTDDGSILMVSTSRSSETGRDETIAIEYEVIPETGGLHEIWSYGRGLGLHAPYHGGARVLPNGNRLVNFGAAGAIHEATPEGQTAWALTSVRDVALGSTLMVDSLYDLTD